MISRDYFINELGISNKILDILDEIEKDEVFISKNKKFENIFEINQLKVINAFRKTEITSDDFNWHTGYSYNDRGREKIDELFSNIFKSENSLVRTGFVSGTHAISACFFGILRPGDQIIYATGTPYDSIHSAIGISGSNMGSLKEFGITYDECDMKNDDIDYDTLSEMINKNTKMIVLQRAVGYANRKALTINKIETFANFMKKNHPNIITMVDNCYGEFLEEKEPIEVGIDLIAGSLIKGIGGGIARSGGYVTGKEELVEKVSYRLTCPGIGGEQGAMYGQTINILQGLYFAPTVIKNALKGALLAGELFKKLGFETSPDIGEDRSDIITTIYLKNKERLIAFCEAIQDSAIVDGKFKPVPGPLPGYDDEIIMASGSFIQGSTIDISADAPLREPFAVYYQGGLTYEHAKLGLLLAAEKVDKL